MDIIISQLINNFDFTLIFLINVITYLIIKIIDDNNGSKVPTVWQKRIVMIIVSIAWGILYYFVGDTKLIVIINSIIVAPVSWSWLAKPIAKRFGIDYKHLDRNAK